MKFPETELTQQVGGESRAAGRGSRREAAEPLGAKVVVVARSRRPVAAISGVACRGAQIL